jgi:glycosyltransferase involved in cell wall biosynthesis
MKVLWLSHFVPYPPRGHGSLQRSHNLLKAVASRHEVHFLALCPPGTLPSLDAVREAKRELSKVAASVDIVVLPPDPFRARHTLGAAFAFLQSASFWESWFWSATAFERLQRLARSGNFDLFHLETIFLGRYLHAVPGVPVVLSHHNVESQLLASRAAGERRPWLKLFFTRESKKVAARERELVGNVAQNVVVSDLDSSRLRELAPTDAITTVPNGVDIEYFRANGTHSAKPGTLIFVGGMDWFPNRDAMELFVAEIWPALLSDDSNRRMTIVGRKPPAAVVAAAQDPRLRVLGFVDDVRPHLENASIYVCPIRLGGGTRLKILDALAMSRPLVSTEFGVEGLGLTDGEHYLSASTPADFVRQVRRLEADPALRQRLGDAGREFVARHYSWPRVAESLEEAYAKAL